MNDKEITRKELEQFTRDQIIDLYLVMDAGYKDEMRDKVEKLDVVEDTIKYILDGKYQEAIEMLVLAFYNGYIPMSILQSVLDRFEFPNGNSEGGSNEQGRIY